MKTRPSSEPGTRGGPVLRWPLALAQRPPSGLFFRGGRVRPAVWPDFQFFRSGAQGRPVGAVRGSGWRVMGKKGGAYRASGRPVASFEAFVFRRFLIQCGTSLLLLLNIEGRRVQIEGIPIGRCVYYFFIFF